MTEPDPHYMDLPYITSPLDGIGGRIKSEPGHFRVEEIPLYEPCGQGDHVYLRLTREEWNTRDLVKKLAGIFSLRDVDIGTAGQKDKKARVTQTFSLFLPNIPPEQVIGRVEGSLPVRVESAGRHKNKLKTGHLLGNSFTILLTEPREGALGKALEISEMMKQTGVANFYGPQRFGHRGENVSKGREALAGRGPRKHWLRRFLLSAYQAWLFNAWMTERIHRGWFQSILIGDVAKKTDTGGLFEVEDLESETKRFNEREITYTGPIYGSRMRWAGGEPGELERLILRENHITEDMLRKGKLDGSRRPARLFLPFIDVQPDEGGLVFRFSLPKGSYATTVMREFIKNGEEGLPEE